MAAHQPDPDPTPLPLPLLIVGDTGLDADLLAGLDADLLAGLGADLLAGLGATPIRINHAGRPLNPLEAGSLPGVSAPATGA